MKWGYFFYAIVGISGFYLIIKIGAWAVFKAYFQVKKLEEKEHKK